MLARRKIGLLRECVRPDPGDDLPSADRLARPLDSRIKNIESTIFRDEATCPPSLGAVALETEEMGEQDRAFNRSSGSIAMLFVVDWKLGLLSSWRS